jgi:hypothetical protein
MEQRYNCKGSRLEYIEEFFHPAGPVRYTNLYGVTFEGGCGLFDITLKEELRKV